MYLKFEDFSQHIDEANQAEEKELLESLSEFNFEMIKEFEEYQNIESEEPLDESAFGLAIKNLGIQSHPGVNGKALYISINGNMYGYQSEDGLELDELARKFTKMIGLGAGGNALAWVKKHSNLVFGSVKKVKEPDAAAA